MLHYLSINWAFRCFSFSCDCDAGVIACQLHDNQLDSAAGQLEFLGEFKDNVNINKSPVSRHTHTLLCYGALEIVLVLLLLLFFIFIFLNYFLDPGTSFPGCETLSISVWCVIIIIINTYRMWVSIVERHVIELLYSVYIINSFILFETKV